jgi:hypothetical protein
MQGGGKDRVYSFLILKYFIQAVKLRWATQNLLWYLNLPSFSCDPSVIWYGPLGGHTVHFENK